MLTTDQINAILDAETVWCGDIKNGQQDCVVLYEGKFFLYSWNFRVQNYIDMYEVEPIGWMPLT